LYVFFHDCFSPGFYFAYAQRCAALGFSGSLRVGWRAPQQVAIARFGPRGPFKDNLLSIYYWIIIIEELKYKHTI
jgi:hypothetical protein